MKDLRDKIQCKIINKLSSNDLDYHLYSGSFLIKSAGRLEDLILWIDNQNARKDFLRVYDYKLEIF
jgi:hypothetical protein